MSTGDSIAILSATAEGRPVVIIASTVSCASHLPVYQLDSYLESSSRRSFTIVRTMKIPGLHVMLRQDGRRKKIGTITI